MKERPSHIVGRRPTVPRAVVVAIRRSYGRTSLRELAAMHGLTVANVKSISRRRTYQWVAP